MGVVNSTANQETGPPGEISAEEYNATLGGLALIGVGLNGCSSAVFNRQKIQHLLSIGQLPEPTLTFQCGFGNVQDEGVQYTTIQQQVDVNCTAADGELLFGVSCVLQLDFTSERAFTPEFFEIFKTGPLLFMMMPYAREFVQSMTVRMAVPPITLPIVHAPAPSKKAAKKASGGRMKDASGKGTQRHQSDSV